RLIGNPAQYLFNGFLHTCNTRLLSLPSPIMHPTKLNSHRKTLHNDLKTLLIVPMTMPLLYSVVLSIHFQCFLIPIRMAITFIQQNFAVIDPFCNGIALICRAKRHLGGQYRETALVIELINECDQGLIDSEITRAKTLQK